VCQVPATWVEGRSAFTLEFEQKAIDTLKECDVQGACRLLKSKWDQTWAVVERAVARGQARKERRIPKYMGVDEKSFAKRHRYETLVCDLKAKKATVEYVVDDRRRESLESYFAHFSQEELAGVEAVAMDMWEPYILATKAKVPGAKDKIVFDRFHVFRYVTEAVDQVRRDENKAMLERGNRRLVGTRYLWLRNAEKLTLSQRDEFNAIWSSGLKTGRAWVLKEVLRGFWDQPSAAKAKAFFKRWYHRATHSRLEPMIQAAKTMKRHLANILTYFTHRITNATAEGLNSKIQMVKAMACGFRNREHYKTAIYFHCGGLDLYPRAPAGV
jgi:transposase